MVLNTERSVQLQNIVVLANTLTTTEQEAVEATSILRHKCRIAVKSLLDDLTFGVEAGDEAKAIFDLRLGKIKLTGITVIAGEAFQFPNIMVPEFEPSDIIEIHLYSSDGTEISGSASLTIMEV